jgi:hypothetical protein
MNIEYSLSVSLLPSLTPASALPSTPFGEPDMTSGEANRQMMAQVIDPTSR